MDIVNGDVLPGAIQHAGTLTSDVCSNKIRDPCKSDHKRHALLAIVNNNLSCVTT